MPKDSTTISEVPNVSTPPYPPPPPLVAQIGYRRRLRCRRLEALLWTLVTAVLLSWLADLAMEVLGPRLPGLSPASVEQATTPPPLSTHTILWLLTLFISPLLTTWRLFALRGTILGSRARMDFKPSSPISAMVMILSTSTPTLEWDEENQAGKGKGMDIIHAARKELKKGWNGLNEICQKEWSDQFFDNLEKENDTKEEYKDIDGKREKKKRAQSWNWQQTLRAVRDIPGRTLLEVVLIGSRPEDTKDGKKQEGSASQIGAARKLLECAFRWRCDITAYPHALGFENYDELHDAVCDAIDRLCDRHRIKPRQVLVNITGGTALASAAVAVAAINRGAIIGYVSTNAPCNLRLYEASIEGLGGP